MNIQTAKKEKIRDPRWLGTGHKASARVGWREYGWVMKYIVTNWVGYQIMYAVLGGP